MRLMQMQLQTVRFACLSLMNIIDLLLEQKEDEVSEVRGIEKPLRVGDSFKKVSEEECLHNEEDRLKIPVMGNPHMGQCRKCGKTFDHKEEGDD